MLVTGIIGHKGKTRTANLIHSILTHKGLRISIADSKNLVERDPKHLKDYLKELDRSGIQIFIMKINLLDIEKQVFQNFHFDIMIYTDKADDLEGIQLDSYRNLIRKNFSMLDEKGVAIINIDDTELISFLHGMKNYILTYGFNSKASVTTSSVGDVLSGGRFLCCLQRKVKAKNGMEFEPQEYSIRVDCEDIDVYNILAAASFAIVNGVDPNSMI